MKNFSLKRLFLMLTGIVFMGITMSFLIGVNYGTDTYSFMALGVSEALKLSYGTSCLLINVLLFIPVVIFERRLIHIGTVMNMVVVGYITDFCMMLNAKFLPEWLFTTLPAKPIVFVAALIPFLIAVAFYMHADLGMSPYDALPTMITRRLKVPFTPVRIGWDMLTIAVGLILGQKLPLGTLVLALTIGPAVDIVGRPLKRFFI